MPYKNGGFLKCKQCGKEFYVPKYRLKEAKFCSKSCGTKYNYPIFLRCGFTMKGKTPYNKKWENRKERKRMYQIELMRKNPQYKLSQHFGRYIKEHLSKNHQITKWRDALGYSMEELKKHLESQFEPGMSWDNHGRNGWHIDHIIPISAFNFTSTDDLDFKKCWALSNLRPMWAGDNISKHCKLTKPFQPSLLLAITAYHQELNGAF